MRSFAGEGCSSVAVVCCLVFFGVICRYGGCLVRLLAVHVVRRYYYLLIRAFVGA